MYATAKLRLENKFLAKPKKELGSIDMVRNKKYKQCKVEMDGGV